jgi:hypothetical protein
MDKENIVYINNGLLHNYEEEWNYVVCRKMNGTGDFHVGWDKSSSKKINFAVFAHMQNLDLKK